MMEHKNMSMYDKVFALARKKGVSVAQVERDLGFSPASLRKMNTNRPTSDKVVALAHYFGVSTDYLYGDTEIEKPADKLMDDDFISLHRARQNMSQDEWDQAMKIIRAGFAYAFEDDER